VKKKILITGGYGFIGYHLIKKIITKNDYLIDINDNVNLNQADKEFKSILKNKNVNYIKCKFKNIKNLKKYDYIIHLAATLGVQNVNKSPFYTLKNNLTDSIEFIDKINERTKIIFFSTSEVYKNLVTRKHFSFRESVEIPITNKIEPRDTYFLSKLIIEKIISLKKNKYLIFRPHNFYGPRMGLKHVISEMILKIKNKNKISVKSYNHQRCFCYIDDAIHIITKIIFSNNYYNNTYNIGNPNEEIKIFDLIKKIKNIQKKNILLKKINFEEGSSVRRKPNINKIKKIYNSKIKFTPLEKGLIRTIQWYEKNYK
jgi:nucleoside-diphosphate-sugar epimerase